MRTIFTEYNPKRNSIDVYTSVGYMLRIDCWESEKNLKTIPGSDCAWRFLHPQLIFYRLWLLQSELVWQFGELSISWRDMEMIIPEPMLMYGKEASNRKQEIDRQHYTIPNQRPKDKHCGKI